VLFGHQDFEASLKFLNPADQFALLALRGSRLGQPGARQFASRLGNLGVHGFFALDQIVTAQSRHGSESNLRQEASHRFHQRVGVRLVVVPLERDA